MSFFRRKCYKYCSFQLWEESQEENSRLRSEMEATRQDLDSTRQQLDSAIQVRRKQYDDDDDDDVMQAKCCPLSLLFHNFFPPITL